ncbi:hypothetical protein [Desulfuribacillus alkaliarsenatis]|uniref:NADPH-dependent FMN reductase-like domain-containing protein n=1 Tax=Desulfuribacillus alkaliarsenatis TaxID=766136 RepID=A0A1E5G266_9FIRM|nr:hypothetical protein [Desulfuribacillus alkaliarsenatis]OEF97066.1 hypothetical protein BHF68_05555 [Desulfuribacillus alkaliarsenatis]
MKTVFDLRANKDSELIDAINNFYADPVKVVALEKQAINACTGCWCCWLKTPGRCTMKDQMTEYYYDYVNSETVIILMDTSQGFINHQAKAFIDRTIPHYHPYIEIIGGECHHVARYKSYPDMLFYYDSTGLTNQEEQIIEDYLYRTAYQFKSKAFRIVREDGFQLRQLESRKPKRQTVAFATTEPMEKLVIYNGSPRKSGSNSATILKKIAEELGDRVEIRDLKQRDNWQMWAENFNSDRHVMFFMPLYVHAMPSHVMNFIEQIGASAGTISFFVQSGFPESSQSYYLEAYFEQLALRLGRTYLGTAIKGGVEGLLMRPPQNQQKMIAPIVRAIANLVSEGAFKTADVSQMAKPIRLDKGMNNIYRVLINFGVINYFFWNLQLKKNGAYEKRFDRPYKIV